MIATICIWAKDWQTEFANLQHCLPNCDLVCILGPLEADPYKIGGSDKKFKTVVSVCNLYNKDIVILTGAHSEDHSLYKKPSEANNSKIKTDIIYWPTFWLTNTLKRLTTGKIYDINTSNNLPIENYNVGLDYEMEYTFLSMNGVSKTHRCVLQDLLAKHDLLKYGRYSWRNKTYISKVYSNNSYNFKYWNIGRRSIFLDQPEGLFIPEVLPPVYKKCFMQIVPESHEDRFFLTEKTSMPLFFNKPFLVAGSVGFHEKLKNMGFMLYDDLFDYSFDKEPCYEKRFEMIVEIVKYYTTLSKEHKHSLYKKIFEKCVYNKKLAVKYASEVDSFPAIWNQLDDPIYEHLDHLNPFRCNNILKVKKKELEL